MADKTGFTGDSVACILLWIYAVCQTSSIKDQTKIGVTYMTMNNEFYKSIHSKLVELPMREGLLYLFEIRIDEKKAEPADR